MLLSGGRNRLTLFHKMGGGYISLKYDIKYMVKLGLKWRLAD